MADDVTYVITDSEWDRNFDQVCERVLPFRSRI